MSTKLRYRLNGGPWIEQTGVPFTIPSTNADLVEVEGISTTVALDPISVSPPAAPSIGALAAVNVPAGTPISVNVAAVTTGTVSTYAMTGNPAWLSINPTTGQITGTSGAPFSGSVSISATGPGGTSPAQSLSITLTEALVVAPADYVGFAEDGNALSLAFDTTGLRVSTDGGNAWQTLADAGLSVSYADNAVQVAGFADSATANAAQFHYEQEQPGEPYNALNSVSGLYFREMGSAAPDNPDLPGFALAPTASGAPIT